VDDTVAQPTLSARARKPSRRALRRGRDAHRVVLHRHGESDTRDGLHRAAGSAPDGCADEQRMGLPAVSPPPPPDRPDRASSVPAGGGRATCHGLRSPDPGHGGGHVGAGPRKLARRRADLRP